jgi:hypothetical protein
MLLVLFWAGMQMYVSYSSDIFFRVGVKIFTRAHPEMVDFVPRQGRTRIFIRGVATLRRGLKSAENAVLGQNMPFLGGH